MLDVKRLSILREVASRNSFSAAADALYLSRVELEASHKPGMSYWRKRLFLWIAVITAEPADYFKLPRERTVTLGSEIEF